MKRLNFVIILFGLLIVTHLYGQPARTLGGAEVVLDNAGSLVYITTLQGGVGINESNLFPHQCALLDLSSTTKGFLPPRMVAAELAALCGGTPPEAMMAYNTTVRNNAIYNGTRWMNPWTNAGNMGTNAATDYLGTSDGMDFVVRTNAVERMRFIGLPAPNTALAPTAVIA